MLWNKKIDMLGEAGYEKIVIPSNLELEVNFVSIVNLTDNTVCIYTSHFQEPTVGQNIVCLNAYSTLTIPILPEIRREFNIVWTNPRLSNLDKNKHTWLIFTRENLGYNTSYAPSWIAGGEVMNTNIAFDDVGLARKIQLPTELTGAGNLKVALLEDIVGLLTENRFNLFSTNLLTLLNLLVDNNNLKVDIKKAVELVKNEPGTDYILLASANRNSNGNTQGTPIEVKKYKEGDFFLEVTAKGGTLPTLDVWIQSKDPASGVWFDLEKFTQVTDVTTLPFRELKKWGYLGSLMACRWEIGGSDTPNWTFSLGAVLK